MAERQLSDAEAEGLSGLVVGPGCTIPVTDAAWYAAGNRALARLAYALRAAAGMEVVKSDTAVLRICIRAGRASDGDTSYVFAELDNQVVVANATNYVYLTVADLAAGNTVTINQAAFPDPATTPHVPLATVVCGAVDFAWSDITDCRAESMLRPLAAMTAANANTLVGGGNADALHVHDTAGIENDAVTTDKILDAAVTDAKIASSIVKRPSSLAWGAVYFTGRPADAELLTINGRKYEIDKDASFPDAAGDEIIDCNGAGDTDDDITACAAAINGDGSATVDAVADLTNDVLWLYAKTAGAAGNAITLATTMTNTTVSDATLVDGADAAVSCLVSINHVLTATEAAAGIVRIDTGLSVIASAHVCQEDAGVLQTDGMTVVVAAGVVTIGEGSATWAAADMLDVLVVGLD